MAYTEPGFAFFLPQMKDLSDCRDVVKSRTRHPPIFNTFPFFNYGFISL